MDQLQDGEDKFLEVTFHRKTTNYHREDIQLVEKGKQNHRQCPIKKHIDVHIVKSIPHFS